MKINSNEKIKSVIFTNAGECVIGVTTEQQCIMINFRYEELKGDGGIRMVQESARAMGDEIIDDLNEMFRTDTTSFILHIYPYSKIMQMHVIGNIRSSYQEKAQYLQLM